MKQKSLGFRPPSSLLKWEHSSLSYPFQPHFILSTLFLIQSLLFKIEAFYFFRQTCELYLEFTVLICHDIWFLQKQMIFASNTSAAKSVFTARFYASCSTGFFGLVARWTLRRASLGTACNMVQVFTLSSHSLPEPNPSLPLCCFWDCQCKTRPVNRYKGCTQSGPLRESKPTNRAVPQRSG